MYCETVLDNFLNFSSLGIEEGFSVRSTSVRIKIQTIVTSLRLKNQEFLHKLAKDIFAGSFVRKISYIYHIIVL